MRVLRLFPAPVAALLVSLSALRAQQPPPRDSARAPFQDSALTMNLVGRLEFKGERTKNERCFANQFFSTTFRCRSPFTPGLDFQFSLSSSGSVADRVHVNVDYDSQREFDGSNNISIAYRGKPGELLQHLEIGNVSFTPPVSRFITSGIPSGNYGVQAVGQWGPLRFSAIAAQQKGTVVRDQVFTVGSRTTQAVDRELEDYQIEPRRFFFTVDPVLFGARYPNLDILDPRLMGDLAASLADTVRPSRVFLYRLLIGGQPPNPDGPRFILLGDPDSRAGQVYELLREGVDYYLDPSLLWVALVRPLSLANERLVVAYTLRIAGRDTTVARLGGTPDLQFTLDHPQYAHVVWDPRLSPDDPAFGREIRSVYRVGGEDVRRESVSVRLVAGSGGDQEKPPGAATTYLQIFGLAQRTNPALFDAHNRLWPRPDDPNDLIGPTTPAGLLIRDRYLVFPSLEPFSRRGLARLSTIAANDTMYRTPGEYLYSAQHPQSFYRLRMRYETQGVGAGTIALASVQLRPGSERLTLDGRPLVRGIDYDIDYDLGRVRLLSVDTLSLRPQRLVARYEENPLFTTVPTSIFGFSTEWAFSSGSVAFTAISQHQRTTFTRPPLGFEPQGSLMAGVSSAFAWTLGGVSRGLARLLPGADSAAPSRLDVRAEIAVSQPRQSGAQQAYIESFEGEGGISVSLLDSQWQYGSQPALGNSLPARLGAQSLDTMRAATLAFQNNGTDANGRAVTFSIQQIDPLTALVGGAFAGFEPILWLTLYPLNIGGLFDDASSTYRWRIAGRPSGRRWRSVRTALGGTGTGGNGVDLTRAEALELWTLVDTAGARRATNPMLMLDFGDVSENSVTFSPESLRVVGTDSLYSGKKLQGFDILNSERDAFSRAFSADVNDLGLPGDVVDRLAVVSGGMTTTAFSFPTCMLGFGRPLRLGDTRADCTVRNSRLDEEDIDQDNFLNFTSAQRERERTRRFLIDLSDPRSYNRIGTCDVLLNDVNQSHPAGARLCWVQVRVPFSAPDDSTGGGPLLRRVRALRLTVISGAAAADDQFTLVPVTRLRLVGASLFKRAPRPLRGIGGEEQALGGYVVATIIGTQDRDSTRGLVYEPPPGVTDEPEQQGTTFGLAGAPINERSMRLLAGDLARYSRAEAYVRFPEGQRSVMSYRELRVWARGRGRGWGVNSDLEFFVKLGRDANNFYVFRTPVNSGASRAAWDPEIRVSFARFYALRARIQEALIQGTTGSLGCTGPDSALIAVSGAPMGGTGQRLAACDGGYMVYTVDAAVTPPNLNAVQELAVGIVRVDSLRGADPPLPGDSLEVWVDDIRLADADQNAGYAGLAGVTFIGGDAVSIRLEATRHDPDFRQLGEPPSFLTGNEVELATTWRLDKLVRGGFGLIAPLTITHRASSAEPAFLSRSDVRGRGIASLRTPRGATTAVAFSVRRATPLAGGWFAPLVNHLGASAAWNGAGARSEYTRGRSRNVDVGLDYFFIGPEAGAPSPEGGRSGAFGPSAVRISSRYSRADDRIDAFLKPAAAADDSASRARALQRLLRNSTSLEFRPATGVTARWDAVSVRDLRDYDDGTPLALAASQERTSVGGVNVGLERERNLLASVLYAPAPESWLRPRIELSSSFSILRDPNAPVLFALADSTAPRLARRFGNTQRAGAAAAVDLRRAVPRAAPEGSLVRRLAAIIGPIDVSVSRDQRSSYDAAPLGPSLQYQFGLGAIDAFRSLRDVLASSAGAGTQLALGNTLTLPFGATITQRVQRTETRHWSRRLQDRQSVIDGEQLVYPDLSLRWSGRPLWLGGLFDNVAATARAAHTRQAFLSPTVVIGVPDELRAVRTRSYPLSVSATTATGKVSVTGAVSRLERVDSLPGSVGQSRSSEVSADAAKEFALPAAWKVDRGLRARLSYQRAETKSYVSNIAAIGARSRLTDNGRRAVTLNAGTDLAENLSFSLQGSRVVTFDRNFNRRFIQTVFSAVLNIQFFGGALR